VSAEPIALRAPAKLNLCLYVGPKRDDGLHEIASIFEPLELADELLVSEAPGPGDEVVCAEVGGPNLVEKALAAMRAAGWISSPLRVEIAKRIPVAAGLGGGSADAAAVLRLARGELEGLRAIAAAVGADVPSQLQPRPCVVSGAGEVVEPIPPPARHAVVLVPQTMGLTTAEVYAEADRLARTRGAAELESIRRKLRDAVVEGASPLRYPEHLVNDLQAAAVSLRPEIAGVLDALAAAGAAQTLVTGSGPTAFGLFGNRAEADQAVAALAGRFPSAVATEPLDPAAGVGPELARG
jgi:4-diphosphocytidyl-2-C-methyl-D-erythritol kinase